MKIINKGLKKGYLIHESSTGHYSVCKILNEYNNKHDVTKDLVKLLSNNKTEKDLLRQYSGVNMNWFMRLLKIIRE